MPVLERVLERRRSYPSLLGTAVAVFLCSLAVSAASASAAQVSGRVFNDFNTNGVFDTDENAGAVDVGVSGLTIQAFTGTGTLVGTATSGAGAADILNLPDARVRLELAVVRPWWPTRQLNGLRSDVQFVAGPRPRPAWISACTARRSSPSTTRPCSSFPLRAGPPDASNPRRGPDCDPGGALLSREGPKVRCRIGITLRRGSNGLRPAQVGTVFGLAINPRTGDIYAGVFYKRMAGLKDREPGAIFKITPQGDVSVFHTARRGRGPPPGEHQYR